MSGLPVGQALLGFDTSTEQLSVVLLWADQCLTDNSAGGAAASSQLLPRVQALLGRADLSLQRLDAIAFGAGPGAFTGLRTSCAVAQGLAYGLGRPVLPIDSLLIVAEDARFQAALVSGSAPRDVFDVLDIFDVAVAVDARMDEAYAARYRHGPQGWQTIDAPALVSRAALIADGSFAAASPWRAGSAWSAFTEPASRPQGVVQFDKEGDRAAALGRLALLAWHAGASVEPALALPVYLRDRVAQTTLERQAAKEQAARSSAG
jgi:tRNA threonylcarbamoyladenosine biosynthesis protein TsaB